MSAKHGAQLLHNKCCMVQQVMLLKLVQLLILSAKAVINTLIVRLMSHCHPLCQLVHSGVI